MPLTPAWLTPILNELSYEFPEGEILNEDYGNTWLFKPYKDSRRTYPLKQMYYHKRDGYTGFRQLAMEGLDDFVNQILRDRKKEGKGAQRKGL